MGWALLFSALLPRDTAHCLSIGALGHKEGKGLTNPSANEASLEKAGLLLSRICNPYPRDSACWESVPEHHGSQDSVMV